MSGVLYAMLASASSSHYTELALSTFLNSTELTDKDEFLLVDNDNTGKYTDISTIQNNIPKSFAENCNNLIDIAAGRHLIILSNDVIFTKGWNKPLIQYSSAITIPSCNQTHIYNYGNLQLSPSMKIEEYEGHHSELEKIAEFHSKSNHQLYENLIMAFYVFSLPARVYSKVGKFDESFGIGGGEDVDYRIRSLKRGIPVKYLPLSYLLHFGGKSTWDGPEKDLEILERNRHYFEVFSQKWGEDLANLCLVGGNPIPVIERYSLTEYINRQDFSGAISAVLNIRDTTQ